MKAPALIRLYWQEALTFLMFLVWSGGYFWISTLVNVEEGYSLGLQIDDKIPFIPEFVLIYVGLYPMFFLPFLLVKDNEYFKIFTGAYITVMFVCYSVFLLFPVSIVRPVLEVTDFPTWVLSIVYSNDKPVNCFPSTHVAMTTMAALTIWEINRLYGALAILYAAAIAASTLLTKQHYVLDVVIAIVLTLIIYYAYFKQKIIHVLGRHWAAWDMDMDRYFSNWFDRRWGDIIDRRISKKLDEFFKKDDGSD